MHRLSFKSRKNHHAVKPGQMIFSNVGIYNTVLREGYRYFVTFVDDCSKSIVVYPMKCKSDVFQCFKVFQTTFEKSGQHSILALTTNNGGEYLSSQFSQYITVSGIVHVPGPPQTPQLNGVAECANQTIGNLIRCSIIDSSLPNTFWVDALHHSFFSYNSYPCVTPKSFRTPNSILEKDDVDLSCLHPFSCLAWYKLPKAERSKLNPKARLSVLLSYLPNGKGYRLWDIQRWLVIKSRDVIFYDSKFPYGNPVRQPVNQSR